MLRPALSMRAALSENRLARSNEAPGRLKLKEHHRCFPAGNLYRLRQLPASLSQYQGITSNLSALSGGTASFEPVRYYQIPGHFPELVLRRIRWHGGVNLGSNSPA